jgi:hypothetical protein
MINYVRIGKSNGSQPERESLTFGVDNAGSGTSPSSRNYPGQRSLNGLTDLASLEAMTALNDGDSVAEESQRPDDPRSRTRGAPRHRLGDLLRRLTPDLAHPGKVADKPLKL